LFWPATKETGDEEGEGGEPERGGAGGVGGGERSICVVDFLNLPPLWGKTIRPLHLNPSHTFFWAIAIIITLVIHSSLKD
jgi:hypothetical protein